MASSLKRSRGQAELDGSPLALKKSTGKPSRDHLAELSLQNHHYNQELFERLERDEQRRGKTYAEALASATREHERVRRAAQRIQEWNLLQIEKARQQEEDEQIRELDRQRQEKLQHDIEERRRHADEARKQGELRRQAEQEEEELQKLETARKEEERQANERRKAAEEASNRQPVQQTQLEEQRESSVLPNPISTDSSQQSLTKTSIEALATEHDRYLQLHRWLKQMRRDVTSKSKNIPEYKKVIGDWRREITKCVGQLNGEGNTTVASRNRVAGILREAKNYTQVTVDVRPCFPMDIPDGLNESNCTISGLLIYGLNIFAKAVVNQWAREASAKPDTADPPGIMATYLFGIDDFKIYGHTLLHILLAKFHKACPILFGVYGNEATEAGRERLGWRKEDDNGSKRWVSEQTHNDRMAGLAAGYASIALRDFSRAPFPNPYPSGNYWSAFARIVNTPATDITQSHLITLKALIENNVERFAKFYGNAAKVALRTALMDFPQRTPNGGAAQTGLATLPALLIKHHGIRL